VRARTNGGSISSSNRRRPVSKAAVGPGLCRDDGRDRSAIAIGQ
jgi:hypothetical protein